MPKKSSSKGTREATANDRKSVRYNDQNVPIGTGGETHQIADHLAGTLIFCPNCRLSLDCPPPEHLPVVEDVDPVVDVLAEPGLSSQEAVSEVAGRGGSFAFCDTDSMAIVTDHSAIDPDRADLCARPRCRGGCRTDAAVCIPTEPRREARD